MKDKFMRNPVIVDNQTTTKRCLSPVNVDQSRQQEMSCQSMLPSIDNV